MNGRKTSHTFIRKGTGFWKPIKQGRTRVNRCPCLIEVGPVPAPEWPETQVRTLCGLSIDTHKQPVPQIKNGHAFLFNCPFNTWASPDLKDQKVPRKEEERVKCIGHATTVRAPTYLVWRKGMGRDTHRKGSKVLLCFRQWGQVREDLWRQRTEMNCNHAYVAWWSLKNLDTGLLQHFLFSNSTQNWEHVSSKLLICKCYLQLCSQESGVGKQQEYPAVDKE